uniref:Uncharacterized protein n=1 Tax=Ciona intestinalis TaxID=7719 RepID=H2XR79_CIOIN
MHHPYSYPFYAYRHGYPVTWAVLCYEPRCVISNVWILGNRI